uniref:Uncharacterized protein n=1 Tax=Aegilops tauschii subsp. strangulata TaxID=200361 RepID=A0A453D8V5_AEGTS
MGGVGQVPTALNSRGVQEKQSISGETEAHRRSWSHAARGLAREGGGGPEFLPVLVYSLTEVIIQG